jgi:hypothetical protein
MCTRNYLCYGLLIQVKTVTTLLSYFYKISCNNILNLKSVYQIPSMHILWLIFQYAVLVLHILRTYLNHHFPIRLYQHPVSMKVMGKH